MRGFAEFCQPTLPGPESSAVIEMNTQTKILPFSDGRCTYGTDLWSQYVVHLKPV